MIELRPSRIILHGYEYNEDQTTQLEKHLSVWNKVIFAVEWAAFVPRENSLLLPGGVNLYDIKKHFKGEVLDNTHKATGFRRINYNMTFEPRDQIQKNAVDFLMEEGLTQKFLCLETGLGKTFCTIYSISKKHKTPIIMVDQSSFIEQWKKEFLRFTDLKEEDIFVIQGIDSIKKLKKEKKYYKVYIGVHATLASYGKNNPENINLLFKALGIGIKVYDEAHVEWKNIVMIDTCTDISETVYLTATPNRSNHTEDTIYQRVFGEIAEYGLEEKYKEEEAYHKVVYLSYNTNPDLDTEIRLSKKNRHGFDVNGYSDFLLESRYEQFFDMFVTIMDGMYSKRPKTKLALVVHKNDMAQKLYDDMTIQYPDKTVGLFCGIIKNKNERMKELERDIIITTDKSFDKGIDVPDLEVVFCSVPFSSKVKAEQMIGRLRKVGNKPCIYFDMTDLGFKSCKNQRTYRKEILNLKAKSISQMKF